MGRYQGYEKYKESGVEWLGDIPEYWEQKRIRFAVSLINNKVDAESSNLSYMGLEHIESWTGKRIEDENASSEGVGSHFLPNDVLFGKLRPYLAKVYLSETEGLASTEALVLRCENNIYAGFLKYYILSRDFINIVDSSTFGSKMPRASWDFIGNLFLPVPPLDEQESIAHFLDRKTSQIDTLIAKKAALLEKLDEKRTALISHAVTKGLDRNVPMKDSGVEWLGDIPEHWSITRLRFLVSKIEQGWSPSCHNYQAEEDEWGVLKAGCVNGEVLDLSENKLLPNELEPKLQYEIVDGDILMSRANTRELLGSVAIAISPRKKLILCDKLYRLEPNENINRQYLVRLLRSSIARLQYEQNATGASGSMQNIGQDTVKDLILPLPLLIEQREIAEYLDKKTAEIDRQKAKVKEAIELLKEYRTALITNAVTGKIDVRQVARV